MSEKGTEREVELPAFLANLRNNRDVRRWGRIGFASATIGISLFGMLITVIAYLFFSSAISISQGAVLGQIESAEVAAADLEESLYSLEGARGEALNMTGSLSNAFRSYATGAGGISGSIGGVADAISGLGIGGGALAAQAGELKDSSKELEGASASLMDAAKAADFAGERIGGSLAGVQKLREDVGEARDGLESAKGEVQRAFGALWLGVLLVCIALLALFAALACVGIALLL